MQEISTGFFRSAQILPFLHIVGVILLISLQIVALVFVFAFKNGALRENLLRFFAIFRLLFPLFLALIIFTSFSLANGEQLKFVDPMIEGIIYTQCAVVVFLLLNFIYICYQISRVFKMCDCKCGIFGVDEIKFNDKCADEINDSIVIIGHYFVPLNLCASFLAVFLGVAIRVFL